VYTEITLFVHYKAKEIEDSTSVMLAMMMNALMVVVTVYVAFLFPNF
jgi:hypothetical protein